LLILPLIRFEIASGYAKQQREVMSQSFDFFGTHFTEINKYFPRILEEGGSWKAG